MDATTRAMEATDAPEGAPTEELDVRSLGPPEPMTETLETLTAMDDDAVLVQVNDRVPQFLFPKLEERGFAHESVEDEEATITAIWKP